MGNIFCFDNSIKKRFALDVPYFFLADTSKRTIEETNNLLSALVGLDETNTKPRRNGIIRAWV